MSLNDFSDRYASLDFNKIAWEISGPAAFADSMVRDRQTELYKKYHHLPSVGDQKKIEALLAGLTSSSELPNLSEFAFKLLLSPAADPFLEQMAQLAQRITRQRFGKTIILYAPLYLSNTCKSTCTYCGFSYENNIRRLTLNQKQIQDEADYLIDQGIRHVLLLTGESYKDTPIEYLKEAVESLQDRFSSVSVEIYPLNESEYSTLRSSGLDGLAVYQETYDPVRYRQVHLRGMKKKMEYRLACPERAARAGIRKISIGALAGLSDPAADVFFTGVHARHLTLQYWQSSFSVSLPRLRPAAGLSGANLPVINDRTYLRYLCALRLFLPDAGLNLSTREPVKLRDAIAQICITHMSAGSKTEPGGYNHLESDEQFAIHDTRSVSQTASSIQGYGLDPVLVDWSSALK